MRRLLLGALVGMLPFSALADVTSDLQAGQPMATVFANAQQTGSSVESILGLVIASDQTLGIDALSAAIALDPSNAVSLAEFAIASGLPAATVTTAAMQSAPAQAQAIFSRMQQFNVPEDELLASALDAGQDPTALLEAPAAGPQVPEQAQNQDANIVVPAAQAGRPVSPTAFGSNTGGGGGGNASPS